MKIVMVLAATAVCTASVAMADKAPPKAKIEGVPAQATDEGDGALIEWGGMAGWDLFVDPTLGNGCMAIAEFEDGTWFTIGFDMTTGGGYMTSVDPVWSVVAAGATVPVTVALDGSDYTGEATGFRLGDQTGAQADIADVAFFGELAKTKVLTLSPKGTEGVSLDLADASAAMSGLIDCQDEQNAKSAD